MARTLTPHLSLSLHFWDEQLDYHFKIGFLAICIPGYIFHFIKWFPAYLLIALPFQMALELFLRNFYFRQGDNIKTVTIKSWPIQSQEPGTHSTSPLGGLGTITWDTTSVPRVSSSKKLEFKYISNPNVPGRNTGILAMRKNAHNRNTVYNVTLVLWQMNAAQTLFPKCVTHILIW